MDQTSKISQSTRTLTVVMPHVMKEDSSSLTYLCQQASISSSYCANFTDLFFRLFHLDVSHQNQYPIAALSALADGLDTQKSFWLRADPVQLVADHQTIFMLGTRQLDLTAAETTLLLSELNAYLMRDHLVLHAPHPERWYLQLDAPIGMKTHSPYDAMQQGITACLPTGPQQQKWRALFTELQMLLHQSPINQARLAAGKPVVNAVWFWGDATWPMISERPSAETLPWDTVWSNDVLVKGLADYTGVRYQALDGLSSFWRYPEIPARSLIVYDHLLNNENIESDFFSRLLKSYQQKKWNAINLYLGDRLVYSLTPRKWFEWKRLFKQNHRTL